MTIENAIQQRSFHSETQRAGVNLLFTASWFSKELTRALKELDISWQQFNIMRILKGQAGKPATLKTVSERMIDPMSNTSRLVEKLVCKGFVDRRPGDCDRRKVMISLTEEGKRHLKEASKIVEGIAENLFGHMPERDLKDLNDYLDRLRNNKS